jgi:hypothetical protein
LSATFLSHLANVFSNIYCYFGEKNVFHHYNMITWITVTIAKIRERVIQTNCPS